MYTGRMLDKEHEEWLENHNARKAMAKKNGGKRPASPKKADDSKKSSDEADDLDGRVWRGEAA